MPQSARSTRSTVKEKKSVKRLSFLWQHRFFTGFLAFILLGSMSILIFMAISERRQQQVLEDERQRFSRAEQDITRLTADIIAATGQPVKLVTDKNCSLPSVKLQEQPILCSVSSDMFYELDDEIQANNIQEKVKAAADKVWEFESISSTHNAGDVNRFMRPDAASTAYHDNYEKIIIEYLESTERMGCTNVSTLYLAIKPPYESYRISTSKPYLLEVGLSCSERSEILRYPERKT